MKPLIIIGAGGFGVEALWLASAMNEWQCIGFADDDETKRGSMVGDVRVIGTLEEAFNSSERPLWFHCAVGDNASRKIIFDRAVERNVRPATLIHPTTCIAPGVPIGEGTYIAAGSLIAPRATVGKGVIINTHASVAHDSALGDFSQASPGSRINGYCKVGELAFLGSNASLLPGVAVGASAKIGANSLAIRDVPPGVTVLGVPARKF